MKEGVNKWPKMKKKQENEQIDNRIFIQRNTTEP